MNRVFKKSVKNLFYFFGLKINFVSKGELTEAQKIAWLRKLDVKTIIDVGASKGNVSLNLHKIFPTAKIYAFEPLLDCCEIIKKKLAGIANVRIFNLAISDHRGHSEIFRSAYSGASSMIPMASLHKDLFPVTAGQSVQDVQVDTLDNCFEKLEYDSPVLIKIDVQGLEDKVIKGGQVTFSRAKILLVETSFSRLYEGQPLFNDICRQLEDLGFRYAGVWGNGDFRSPIDGSPLQQDSIFIKD